MAEIVQNTSLLSRLAKNVDLSLTFSFFGIIVLLVLPIPTGFLDLFLAASVGLSLLVFLFVIYIKEPSEFSAFPVVLLGITLFRLGLNVASTRLILLDGYAGQVIQSFGNFVVRGNYVVGAVIFLILIVINFVVITKGAGRIAEVAARFTLDSLPGKQMSIDAELNAGIIDEAVASKRREKLQQEADFYGAMDGASKFVRGDAIAGILITIINIVGGIAIGVFQNNLTLMDALQKYTLLSIGNGLVSQIPALIVSVGAGILITRTSEGAALSDHLGKQLRVYPRAIGIGAAMLFGFAILPGMPFLPFSILGISCGALAYLLNKNQSKWKISEDNSSVKALPGSTVESDQDSLGALNENAGFQSNDLNQAIQTEVFTIELGYSLLSMADKKQGGDLLDRISSVRKQFAKQMGMIIPRISVKDNLNLDSNEYRFLLREKEITTSKVYPNRWLAVNFSSKDHKLDGIETKEPVFGLDAIWVTEQERKNAESYGLTTVDAPAVLVTHLTEVIRENASEMLEREDVQKLIDLVKEKHPTLVNELLPEKVSVGLIQRVLRNLLHERVPVKNLTLILETIGDFIEYTKNADELTEYVRKKLGNYFISSYERQPGSLQCITIDPKLEQILISRIKRTQFDVGLLMSPNFTRKILENMNDLFKSIIDDGHDPILITISELRLPFKRFFEPSFPRMNVLSYQELPPNTYVQNLGTLTVPDDMILDQSGERISSHELAAA